ncbi:MAG: phage tail assembly protein [Synergistaceae bacterium]|nr:phage tail assembly protein [Synergistaceae bacterium]
MQIQLKKAIKHKNEDIYSLDIPLENLTGNDLIDVEEQIIKTGNFAAMTDFSRAYLIAVAAKAAHMPVEALRMMSAHDFSRVITEVRNFLIATDSDETTETNEDPASLPEIS